MQNKERKEMDSDNRPTSDFENPNTSLEDSLTKRLESLPLLSSACSIGRVREVLRSVREKAYTPRVISIGPLHHGREGVKAMEAHKERYLNNFINRTKVRLGSYIDVVRQNEARLRHCYTEPIPFSKDKFTEIILVDAAFIIEVLLKHNCLTSTDENDYVFKKPRLLEDLIPDMLMLENQVPFFILEDLFNHGNITYPDLHGERPSIRMLSLKLFRSIGFPGVEGNLQKINSYEVEHLVALLRRLYLPLKVRSGVYSSAGQFAPSITELHQAGVKFKVRSSDDLFDLQFEKGILEIPELRVERWTELVFRNLVAFEQCFCEEKYLTYYVIALDDLVNSKEDVDLLVKHGIVKNFLGDSNEVAILFNKLPDGCKAPPGGYFYDICRKMMDYCEAPWHNWKANLKQNYFNTPWAIISFIAGVVLLILTLIQTVCSLISIISSN